MSTRKERAAKARFWLTCRGCGGFRVGPHFDPVTKTYVCRPREEQ